MSRVLVNWFTVGGTFNLCLRILLFLWIWTVFGHLTKRVRSLFGGNAPPIPNCLGRFSKRGFTTFSYKRNNINTQKGHFNSTSKPKKVKNMIWSNSNINTQKGHLNSTSKPKNKKDMIWSNSNINYIFIYKFESLPSSS